MLDQLEETVAEFIDRHGLFAGAGGILLAVSGGADSTALLYVLVALKAQGRLEQDLICADINHRLRGPASDADEQFVIEQAHELNIPVVSQAVDVREYAQARKLSVETAARQLRLASLAEIARGTGARGSPRPTRRTTTRRPSCIGSCEGPVSTAWPAFGRRDNSATYSLPARFYARPAPRLSNICSVMSCAWREDQTNTNIAYTRNYIRHKLLPLLQQEAQGDLIEELAELAAAATRLHDRVEREAEEARPGLVQSTAGQLIFHAPRLTALPEIVAVELIRQALVALAVGERDLTQAHYTSLLQLARRDVSGKSVSLPHGFFARREGEQIILSGKGPARRVDRAPKREELRLGTRLAPPNPEPMVLPVPGTTQFAGHEIEAKILRRDEMDATQFQHDKGPFREYLDFDQVKPPMIVRTRRPGDRFQPLGMPEEKKVGKFLTTAKVPRDWREQLLIFADREKIVWVCPMRMSERVKVTERTRQVLQLTVRRP